MNETQPLANLQQWMQSVITHPAGVAAGISSATAQQALSTSLESLETVVTRSRQLSAVERLEVYANAYYARLLECLREEFPATLHAAGEEAFTAFCVGYLQQHPSSSYNLADLGASFSTYLAASRPPRENTAADQPDWADFLIDLAVLERTYSEVFDGPGVEEQPLLTADDLQQIDAESWPQCRLATVPCLRLVQLGFPAHEYASAVRHETPATIPAARPTYLAVTRRDYIVRRTELSATQFFLLGALAEGATIGAAIRRTAESSKGSFDDLLSSLGHWFQRWTVAGYFQSIRD